MKSNLEWQVTRKQRQVHLKWNEMTALLRIFTADKKVFSLTFHNGRIIIAFLNIHSFNDCFNSQEIEFKKRQVNVWSIRSKLIKFHLWIGVTEQLNWKGWCDDEMPMKPADIASYLASLYSLNKTGLVNETWKLLYYKATFLLKSSEWEIRSEHC